VKQGTTPSHWAQIRSFVLRQGRTSTAQERALEEWLPVYGIPFARTPIDLSACFGRAAPRILEIGFGMGDTTATIAAEHPENDYLGIEVHGPGVGSLLKLVHARGLRNVRIIRHDAVEVLEQMIAPDSLDGVNVFFPDPWPKKRHHKRRLIQSRFITLLTDRMKAGARLHIATDWQDYAEHMLAVLRSESRLRNMYEGFAARPASRPLTRFERRGLSLGHPVWDLLFVRGQERETAAGDR
jgi:tRNA (guanine-N7-)-methyltransferase